MRIFKREKSPAFLRMSCRVILLAGGLGCLLFGTSACDPVTAVIGTGAIMTTAAADEREIPGVFSDLSIRSKINYTWLTQESALLDEVSLSVIEGRVVLTGIVSSEILKKRAVELVKKVAGVKSIKDEMIVGKSGGVGDYGSDAWITTKLKTAILFHPQVASRNYSIRTIGQVIYLTGIAQNQAELDIVLSEARQIAGVRRIVNDVRVKTIEERPGYRGAADRRRSQTPENGES